MTDNEFQQLLQQAQGFASSYVHQAKEQRVYPDAESLADLSAFDIDIPEYGIAPEAMLEQLNRIGGPATVPTTGGRYFGFVNGGTHPPALAARWLADAWDQNAALYVMSPIAAHLEQVCETWLVDILGLPKGTAAGFVGGTSMSLSCGLAAARNACLKRRNWDVAKDGLFGAPPVKVVLGEQAHGAVYRSLSLLGLGSDRVVKVPCDDQGRMIPSELPELDENTILILAAGNVNSGSFDDLRALSTKAKAAGAWVHVDGAFGLWAAASKDYRHLCDGIELADSWSVDAHKTLNAPYDSGIIFCRDRDALISALQADGAYLQWSDKRENMLLTADMSRRARGIELWATLITMGRNGVSDLIDRLCTHAQDIAHKLSTKDFRILNEVVFNQVIVACRTPEETQSTLNNIQASGECWCGGSTWDGEPVIRVSVCSHATTTADIDRTVEAFVTARNAAQS